MTDRFEAIKSQGLYDPSFEHDNCGIGAIIDIEGRKSHQLVCDALSIVERLDHRAGKDAEGKTGDGVGILTQIPHDFFVRKMSEQGVCLPAERQYGAGMFFFPQNDLKMRQARSMFDYYAQSRPDDSGMARGGFGSGGARQQGEGLHAPHLSGLYCPPGGNSGGR